MPIQKPGHSSFTDTEGDAWVLAHLCGRPLTPRGDCPLGRETALQGLIWGGDEWPRLAQGGHHPALHPTLPALPPHPWLQVSARDDFSGPELRGEWLTLRAPGETQGVHLEGGKLRLTGLESLLSKHRSSLVARRLQSLNARFETALDFAPEDFQQMAGVAAYYDSRNWVYLRLSRDETLGRTLNIVSSENGQYREHLSPEVALPETGTVQLAVVYTGQVFHFEYSLGGQHWQRLGEDFSAGLLSDEHCGGLSFTGTFLALTCQDLSGRKLVADFLYAEYTEQELVQSSN